MEVSRELGTSEAEFVQELHTGRPCRLPTMEQLAQIVRTYGCFIESRAIVRFVARVRRQAQWTKDARRRAWRRFRASARQKNR
ncbi:hypothetical protein HY732_00240 [Candidatus Uhrbacteria bacterium]|nr:hypothetical protein [Candidatus Uhrbacteria bacterium]